MTDPIDPEVGLDNIRIGPGEDEVEEYEPIPAVLHDNGVVIFDPIEFSDHFNCYAVQYLDGEMLVLDKATRQWHPVTPKKANLTTIK